MVTFINFYSSINIFTLKTQQKTQSLIYNLVLVFLHFEGLTIKQITVFFFALLIFLELSTIFGYFEIMGIVGSKIHQINFGYFGGLAYIYPIALLYPLYCYYKNNKFNLRRLELILTSVFFSLLLLILQFLIFHIGVIGEAIVSTLKSSLGLFGIWVLSLLGIGMCVLAYSEEDIFVLLQKARTSKIRVLLKQARLGIYHQILIPLKNKLKSSIKQLFTPKTPSIFQSPSVELPQSPAPKPNLTNLIDLEPINKIKPAKQLPLHTQTPNSPAQDPIYHHKHDEEIKIQEVIISQPQPSQRATIKVLDEEVPKKENPFLQDDLLRHKSSRISSSAELLKKIRGEEKYIEDKQSEEKPNTTEQQTFAPQEISKLEEELLAQLTLEETQTLTSTPLSNQAIQENTDSKDFDHQETPTQDDLSFDSQITQPSHSLEIENYTKTKATLKTKSSRPHIKTLAENEKLLEEIDKGILETPKDYKLPPIDLLSPAPYSTTEIDEGEIDFKIQNLLEKLSVFKIDGDVVRTYSGPIITTLEFRPAPNVKVSRIQSLENDLAMALEAQSIRIQAPIPGKNVVGIEIPNSSIQTIYLREIFESELFKNSASPLTLALGKDVVGNPFITDLKKLPHLLIAGTTGSGKSVGVNAMILSLLYRNSPDDLKLMMVDPKMVEFMPYSDLPHLITPIITDPKKAVIGLANAVREMERRYALMSQSRTKEIVSYNQKAEKEGLEKFPYFVIIIDELADLMMTAGKEVEYSMARIAQMGRASGMHLIVATQSPRAEVLTGLIKTNLPAHLSYKVGTKIDAGIIGCAGAETLLGRGDMLFTPPGVSGLVRLHAPWSSEEEVNEIVQYIKDQREVMYNPEFSPEEKETFGALDNEELDSEMNELVNKAKEVILQDRKTSGSHLQRRLGVGYNKAANIIEYLEKTGFLSEPNAKGVREIL